MSWFTIAIITALAVAIRDTWVKIFCRSLQPPEIAALELFWSLPLLFCGFLLVDIPALDQTFWWTFLLSLPINCLAYLLYIYSLKLSPLSLTVPFLAFTPVFMLFTGVIVLDEMVNIWGLAGIILIVGGSYLLNYTGLDQGLWQPFMKLRAEKGSLLMLAVAIIFAFAAVLAKKSMLHSSPLFFTFFFFLVFNLTLLAGIFLFSPTRPATLRQHAPKGLLLGTLLTIHVSSHGLAIMLTSAVYMIAIKRCSILFTVILSRLILKEKDIMKRGLGTLLMFGGALLITLLG